MTVNKKCLFAPSAPPAGGPYSHAVAAGGFLFVSGQVPFAPDGSGYVKDTFEGEARLALTNLKRVLDDCGSSLDRVVKTTVFLKDMQNFAAFNQVYTEFFPADPPARTCVQAGRLPLDMQVEIEAIALLKRT